MDALAERRIKVVLIQPQTILTLLAGWKTKEAVRLPLFPDLPPDAEAIVVQHPAVPGTPASAWPFHVVVTHPSFDVVPDDEIPPRIGEHGSAAYATVVFSITGEGDGVVNVDGRTQKIGAPETPTRELPHDARPGVQPTAGDPFPLGATPPAQSIDAPADAPATVADSEPGEGDVKAAPPMVDAEGVAFTGPKFERLSDAECLIFYGENPAPNLHPDDLAEFVAWRNHQQTHATTTAADVAGNRARYRKQGATHVSGAMPQTAPQQPAPPAPGETPFA